MKLKIELETKSSLYIGGVPQGYSLGGIDMVTAVRDGEPYIPASSFKGALREICRDYPCEEVSELYKAYGEVNEPQSDEKIPPHLFVFGVPAVNRSPKLLFSDLTLKQYYENPFSLESKNTITEADGKIASNPRSYKVAAKGLKFVGDMWLRGFSDKNQMNSVKKYIIEMAAKFNDGAYRLGNSKSRGYGYINVKITDQNEEG